MIWSKSTAYARRDLIDGFWRTYSRVPGVLPETIESFKAREKEELDFTALGTAVEERLGRRVHWTTSADIDDVLRGSKAEGARAYWRLFYAKFPASLGTIRLSAIGYSRDGTQAIVDIEHGCEALCGGGHIVLLQRVAGQWVVTQSMGTWVS